jgi:hypothetical protein
MIRPVSVDVPLSTPGIDLRASISRRVFPTFALFPDLMHDEQLITDDASQLAHRQLQTPRLLPAATAGKHDDDDLMKAVRGYETCSCCAYQ